MNRTEKRKNDGFLQDIPKQTNGECAFASLKVAQNSFQHLDCAWGHYNHVLSGDATIMVSTNCPIIGEHIVIILMKNRLP